jgi:hypothetical protein
MKPHLKRFLADSEALSVQEIRRAIASMVTRKPHEIHPLVYFLLIIAPLYLYFLIRQ